MSDIVLFDIDNTLLYTGGAGMRAMGLAFHELFGVENGFAAVPYAGRTDIAIFRDAMTHCGLLDDCFQGHLLRFQEAYYRFLIETLPQSRGQLMPGIPDVLKALGSMPEVFLGLATGNFRRAAFMKLRHYQLADFFAEGAFGDDAEERAVLVALAVQRVVTAAGVAQGEYQAYMIGDTPLDIAAAREAGVKSIGVATGSYSVRELQEAGADLALPDLSTWSTDLLGLFTKKA